MGSTALSVAVLATFTLHVAKVRNISDILEGHPYETSSESQNIYRTKDTLMKYRLRREQA